MLDERPLSLEELERATGRGVRVLVIDSGVDATHPDLGGRPVAAWHVDGTGSAMTVVPEPGQDVYGHGTGVAAIVRQFAPDAELSSLRVLGGDMRAASSRVVAGLNWAVDERFDIVNCSFGTPNPLALPDYKRVVDRAFCRNVLIVAACNNFDFRTAEYPGCFPSVLSTDYEQLDGLEIRWRRGHLVEFAARGAQLKVAWMNGSHRDVSGSSFAAPHLASLVARIRQLRPGWNACQMKALLYRLAEHYASSD